jgi:shikimate dehydrogenase
MTNTCVIGWPITHSRSPLIHNYWRKHYGVAGTYDKRAVPPDQLPAFIADMTLNGLIGCNVTIPHKENILPLVASVDPLATTLNAANTLYFRDGKIYATSTDGEGFGNNLKHHAPHLTLAGATVAVLGAGGSAKAIIGYLRSQAISKIMVANRSPEKIDQLRQLFGMTVSAFDPSSDPSQLGQCDLLVNTTSLGMTGQPRHTISLDALPSHAVVADIVYAPLITDLLRQAERRGLAIVPGLGMLLHQAVGGFELWHGVRPDVTEALTRLVTADLQSNATS